MKSVKIITFVFALFTFGATMAIANEIKIGDLVLKQPAIRATVASAPVSAGYITIENTGSQDDRLIGIEADFSEHPELHTMKVVEGVMSMRPLKDGIVIPAGQTVTLKKGGLHMMFMQLKEQMKVGEEREVELNFEKAGKVKIKMRVVDTAEIEGAHDMNHSGHSHDTN